MGRSEEYAGIPWFWSNQGDIKFQIAGLSTGYHRTVVHHDTDSAKFSGLYYRDGQIIDAGAAADMSTMLKTLRA